MIVFPSDFEGFGLPVAEGMRLGKAVVIGPERATTEVAGGHAFVMADWTADALADAVRAAEAMTDEQRAAARGRGDGVHVGVDDPPDSRDPRGAGQPPGDRVQMSTLRRHASMPSVSHQSGECGR